MSEVLSCSSSDTSLSSEFLVISHPPSSILGAASHLNDLHISVYTAPNDLSPEEIQQKLRDLLKENLELKDTLQQNNLTMKDQFQKLLKWQTEVAQVNQQHYCRMEEVREVVKTLREEKQELQEIIVNYKQKLQDFDNLKEQAEELGMTKEEFSKTKGDLELLQAENQRVGVIQLQLQEELSEALNQLRELKISNERLLIEKRDLMSMNNELQAKLADFQQSLKSEEKNSIEEYLRQPSEASFQDYLFIEKQVKEQSPTKKLDVEQRGIKELLGQLFAEQEKVSALNKEVAALRNQSSILEEELSGLKKKNVEILPIKVLTEAKQQAEIGKIITKSSEANKPMCGVMEGLKASEEKFSMANIYMERYKDRCDSLENWLGVYQDRLESLRSKDDAVIDELRVEVSNLRSTLTKEQALNQEDKRQLSDARKQFEVLLKDYQELLKSWEMYQQEQTKRGQQSEAYYDIQTRNLNEQIDKLTVQLVIAEENLAAKSQEIIELKNRILEYNQQLETLPILQAQVEVYQNDFRQERESREKIHEEKDQALSEVRSLQIRNQQLVDELEAYQRSQFVEFKGKQQEHKKKKPGQYAGPHGDVDTRVATGSSANQTYGTDRNNTLLKTFSKYMPLYSAMQMNTPPQVTEQPEDHLYYCPKCKMGFTELRPLENHVEECLDN